MTKVKLIPLSYHAKERIKEHGEVMILLQENSDKILVESLEKTWHYQNWFGWLEIGNDVDYEIL